MKPANNAPIYIGAYKELAEIARSHGYAMAVHGSVARDLDLICIPWTDSASGPQAVVDEITTKFAFKETDKPPRLREHGRIVYTLSISFGDCFIDMSFMPRAAEIATLRAENEQLRRERDAQRTRQEERVRVLEEALRPFADEFRRLEKNYVGFEIMFTDDVVYVGGKLTIGHLRRAALGNGGGDA